MDTEQQREPGNTVSRCDLLRNHEELEDSLKTNPQAPVPRCSGSAGKLHGLGVRATSRLLERQLPAPRELRVPLGCPGCCWLGGGGAAQHPSQQHSHRLPSPPQGQGTSLTTAGGEGVTVLSPCAFPRLLRSSRHPHSPGAPRERLPQPGEKLQPVLWAGPGAAGICQALAGAAPPRKDAI